MDPAYPIPLDEKQFAQLGELTAILGQVDEILIRTVEKLLKLKRESANFVMGSTKVADTAKIWAEVIRNRTEDLDILWLVSHAQAEIQAVSQGRNDFVHAWFERRAVGFFGEPYWSGWIGGRRVVTARRVRNVKRRPIADLPKVRDQAARLSCLVAHIGHLVHGEPAATSPWLERLGPTLPPRPQPDALPHRAKGQRHQRKPSPT